MRKLNFNLVTIGLMMLLLMASAHAADIDNFFVTPGPEAGEGTEPAGEGTSNSIFTIHFNWHEDDNKLPDPGSLKLCVYTPYVGSTCYPLPETEGRGVPSSDEGRLYEFRITAGVNLVNEHGDAGTYFRNPAHPIPDLRDVIYVPILVAGVNGAPNTITLKLTAEFTPEDTDPTDEEVPETEELEAVEADVIIHDSHVPSRLATAFGYSQYGGVAWDRDYLHAFYTYGSSSGPHPVLTYGLDENFRWRDPDNQASPDDGSSSTCWEFHVVYVNEDNLPPVTYLPGFGGALSPFFSFGFRGGEVDTGVVLYLKNKSWAPDADFITIPMQKVDPSDNNYADGVEYRYIIEPQWRNSYIGLPIGEYEWFIGCSDDYIRTLGGAIPLWPDRELSADGSTTLPWRPFNAIDRFSLDEARHQNPWYKFMSAYNTKTRLDRPTLQPGYSNTYLYPANLHPVVTIGLRDYDPDRSPESATIEPYYPMVNPNGTIQPGGVENQLWDFPILYQHLYGTLPEDAQGSGGEISVWINESNTITPDPANPSTSYKRYTLKPDKDYPLGTDAKQGVLYRLSEPVQLKAGPHSYFFTASDGQTRVRFPVEGHFYQGAHAFDGPYVNNRPVLSNPMVDPPTGSAGDKFRYTVIYKDADNQRPYQARIYIEYDNLGSYVVGEMVKENPADSDYDGVGVKYVFDTANMAQQFQTGERRFYFEFIDDWGAPSDPRDRRLGEKVYWQSAQPRSWIYGPYINQNTRPRLLDGAVTASDQSNNEATLFEYKVRYVDADNQEPKYMDVFIGQKQNNNTITWDNGHRLEPVDPTDKVYSGDGATFHYSCRLTGAPLGKDYYYCFAASDGYDVAEFDPVLSPSAGAVWQTMAANGTPLHKGERITAPDSLFHTTYKPIVGRIFDSPTTNPYRYPVAWSTANNELQLSVNVGGIDYWNGIVPIGGETEADIQYYFATAGPTGITTNTAPTLLNGSVSPNPGDSTMTYEYKVVYRDTDGQFGQAPYYIRVKIDGVSYDMIQQAGQGVPDYKQGVMYYYRTNLLTPQLPHYCYFEASDGSGYAVFDNGVDNVAPIPDVSPSRNSDSPGGIGTIVPMNAPYVNNAPTLTAPAAGAVNPVPGQPLALAQWVNFGIQYRDVNNEAPMIGNPVVYINKLLPGQLPPAPPLEPERTYKVVSIAGNVITASKPDGTSPGWAPNNPVFNGLPIQFQTGTATGDSYRVTANTADTITVFAPGVPNVVVGDQFGLGRIILTKEIGNNNYAGQNGVLYEYRLNTLGAGEYSVHFVSTTREKIGDLNATRDTIVRYPTSGSITGLRIAITPPQGNTGPILSQASTGVPPAPVAFVAPSVGLLGNPFTFAVKYNDLQNNAPMLRALEGVEGFVRLIIDNKPGYYIPMTGPAGPVDYVSGAMYTASVAAVNGEALAAGPHTCYFEASDGWVTTRYPGGSGTLSFSVNQKPTLTLPATPVTPAAGNAGMQYTYSVIYKDADGHAPPVNGVQAWIDHVAYPMTIDASHGLDYVNGVMYKLVVDDPTILLEGDADDHSFYFTATDSYENADPTATVVGPHVYPNDVPTLTVPLVNPVERWTDSTYTYSVLYRDPNGDVPEYVKVYIDGDTEDKALIMDKALGQSDYINGVTYVKTKQGLARGDDHTFFFKTSDYLAEVRSPVAGTHSGPRVMDKPATTLVVNQPAVPPMINQAVTLTGRITPAMAVPVTLTFTRPNGTTSTRTVAPVAATGVFTTQWTPDMTGVAPGLTWSVKASWDGNDAYLGAESAVTIINVGGPSVTVRGLDLVSIPINPASPFPAAIYGDGSYALAQYLPSRRDYAYYFSVPKPSPPTFPLSAIELGRAYWLKIYDNQSKVVTPSGDIASGATNFIMHLNTGWNQIGCPFNHAVAWGSMKVRRNGETVDLQLAASRGWVRSYGWAFQQSATNPYTGQYLLVDPTRNGAINQLQPWRGYWFKSLVECDLIIPPGALNMEANKTLSSAMALKDGWEVKLRASVGDKVDADNGLGVSSVAVKAESPGYLDSYIDLFFTDNGTGAYAYDTRTSAVDGDVWRFKVSTDQTEGLAEVSWTGVENLPIGKTLTLVDETTGKSVVMKAGQAYTFPAGESTEGRSFRVILGSK